MTNKETVYVGRGGDKLAFALNEFGINPQGKICCDLGSHIGGFVDCWLKAGAEKVYSVDTCYGTLDWGLRNNEQVVVMERTNALHVELPEPVDFISCDVGWTPQKKVLPKAIELIKPGGIILSLLKPQYEADKKTEMIRGKGRVKEDCLDAIIERIDEVLKSLGQPYQGPVRTPFLGDKGKNPEFFMMIGPICKNQE
ncbi:MAG: SAM-dependent methyltransferase [Planctomycetota bacterium]|jgi:23S rRNA (cytidine1920-2'-O)/16S rRNA (cytidine1409-2'-O)-methyltransferase